MKVRHIRAAASFAEAGFLREALDLLIRKGATWQQASRFVAAKVQA